ncbi:MAG: type II CAAX prenyl endopeptidase Rce1 family protein [Bacteroidales bacterium]
MTIKYFYPNNIKKDSIKFRELVIYSVLLIYIYLIADPLSTLLGTSFHTQSFNSFDMPDILAIVIIAPFIEEITFRVHLSGEKKHAWGLLLMVFTFSIFLEFWWTVVIILLFGGFVFLLYEGFSEFITGKFFNMIFFISCILFSLAHYNEIDSDSFYIKILIVLIYLPISIYFAYTRRKYGLIIAIGAHSFYNFSVLTINSLVY